MKKTTVLFFVTLLHLVSLAQTICHTQQIASKELMQRYCLKTRTSNNNSYILYVYFHVIRKSDGTGGHTLQDVNDTFSLLNADFNSHNIYFVWNGTIDYIDDTNKYYVPSVSIFTYNNHQNGIDIYLYSDDIDEDDAGGLANGVGNSSEFYVGGKYWKTPYPSLVPSHVVSHEMGHVLGLWHTHHGTFNEGGDTNQCAELVDGSNSDTCGDYIEDTPADPNLSYNVNPATFQWLGTGIDANGDTYIPDTRLIMSYTDVRCMSYFSTMQGEKMRDNIENLTYLQNSLASTHIESITGSSVVCGTQTYYVSELPIGMSVSWSLTFNSGSSAQLATDTPSTNQCQVTRTASTSFSAALTATITYQGQTIKTLTKALSGNIPIAMSFYTYSTTQGGAGLPHPFSTTNYINVVPNTYYYVTSPSLPGMTLTPSFPSGVPGYTMTRVSETEIRVSLPPSGFMTVAATGSGCDNFSFTFAASSSKSYALDISGEGNLMQVSLVPNTEVLNARNAGQEEENINWTLEVYESAKAELTTTQKVEGLSCTLDTSRWKPGIYIVRAIIGDETLTEKINLK